MTWMRTDLRVFWMTHLPLTFFRVLWSMLRVHVAAVFDASRYLPETLHLLLEL